MNSISNISILQIEVFLCAAESRSITEAARRLYISQSAATRWIQKLENSMNITLFVRTNQGIELSEDGLSLYRQLKAAYTRLKAVFLDYRHVDSRSPVRIACMDAAEIISEISSIIQRYENMYSRSDIDVTMCNCYDLREGILSGKYDCALTYSVSSKDLPGLEFRPVKHMDTYFVVSANSPCIEGDRLNYEKMAKSYMYIQPTTKYDMSGSRDLSVCRSHGFAPLGIRYVSEEATVATFVRDMNGFSIAGTGFGMQYQDQIRLFPMEKPIEEEQYIGLLWRPDVCSAHTRMFVESVPHMLLGTTSP